MVFAVYILLRMCSIGRCRRRRHSAPSSLNGHQNLLPGAVQSGVACYGRRRTVVGEIFDRADPSGPNNLMENLLLVSHKIRENSYIIEQVLRDLQSTQESYEHLLESWQRNSSFDSAACNQSRSVASETSQFRAM